MSQKVLLIDHSTSIHQLIREHLAGEALSVFTASTGQEGLDQAGSLVPDLILLDVDLPDLDGLEVCRRLKRESATTAIPIIFLTGASTPDDRIYGTDLGAVDFIIKPFNPVEMRARVRGALRTKYLLDLLAHKAQIDGLTGLWNRTYFEDRLAREISLTRRSGRPLACVLVDVDHFKTFNDTYGHPFGDEVIRGVAKTLSRTIRLEDVICRLGGDEFVILCPNTNAVGAEAMAERCRNAVAAMQFLCADELVRVTCSFGVAQDIGPKNSIIEEADKALYQAKSNGRDGVAVSSAPGVVCTAFDI